MEFEDYLNQCVILHPFNKRWFPT